MAKPSQERLPPAETSHARWASWLAGLALVALTAIVYAPTLRNGYVSDDSGYVVSNFALRSLGGLYDIWFTIGTVQQYYPMVFSMFWLEWHAWGLHPMGYHAVNLLLHAAAAILLWRVLLRLELPGAWLAAAIFAVHPVEVESVAWISERKNVLSCTLALAAMLSYWRFAPPEAPNKSPRELAAERSAWGYYGLALVLFVGALLSKTVTASMPAVLLVIVWWKRGRITWRDVKPLLPFFAVGIGLGLVTVWMEKVFVGAQGDRFQFTPIDRVLIAGRAVWFYAGKLAWPYPLMFFYPRWTIDPHVWWQYVFPITAVVLLAILWRERDRIGRGPLAAALIFGGVLVPAIGFFDVFPFRFSFVADHYQYHASIALIALAAAALATAVRRYAPVARWAMPVASAVVLVPLAVLAHQKTYVYWDNFTLHDDVVRLNPEPWVAYNNIAGILLNEKKYDEALEVLQKTIRLIPQDPVPHANLGTVYTEMGRYEDARAELDLAMKLHVDKDEKAWISRLIGALQVKQNELDAALESFNISLQLQPEWTAFMQRGRVRAMQGDAAGAETDLNAALQLQPDSTEARELRAKLLTSTGRFDAALADLHVLEAQLPNNPQVAVQLGNVLHAARRWKEAIGAYDQAIRLDPKNADAHRGRAESFLASGAVAPAARDYQTALDLGSTDVLAMNNLAWIRATSPEARLRNGNQAVELATAACKATKYQRAELLSTLAAAQAESGDFTAAVESTNKALQVATPALRDTLRPQLEAYQAGRPWREPAGG